MEISNFTHGLRKWPVFDDKTTMMPPALTSSSFIKLPIILGGWLGAITVGFWLMWVSAPLPPKTEINLDAVHGHKSAINPKIKMAEKLKKRPGPAFMDTPLLLPPKSQVKVKAE